MFIIELRVGLQDIDFRLVLVGFVFKVFTRRHMEAAVIHL